jgi:hypothetical protein
MLYFVFVDGDPVFGTSDNEKAEARLNEESTKSIKQTAADNDLNFPEDEERAMEQSDCPCHICEIENTEWDNAREGEELSLSQIGGGGEETAMYEELKKVLK